MGWIPLRANCYYLISGVSRDGSVKRNWIFTSAPAQSHISRAVRDRRSALRDALNSSEGSGKVGRAAFSTLEAIAGNVITAGRRRSFPCARLSPKLCNACSLARMHFKTGFVFIRGRPYVEGEPDYLLMRPFANPFHPGLKDSAYILLKKELTIREISEAELNLYFPPLIPKKEA